jgi:hypothetical protein
MYSIDKYAADAMAAQRKQLEEKLAQLEALRVFYVAREQARHALIDAMNDEGPGANDRIAVARTEAVAAVAELENALCVVFGAVSNQWRP